MALLRCSDGLWLKLIGRLFSDISVWIRWPKTGGKDESGMALLRTTPDLFRKLVGKGVLRLTFLCLLTDPPLVRRVILGVSASDVWPLVNKWERS